jgi:hypothetical protein
LGVQGEPDSYRSPHHTFRKALVVVVVVVVAIGGYALYRHNQPSSQTQAMRAFCAAIAGATDQANGDDDPGLLRTFQELVDKDGLAVGGQVSSDTIGLEAAISDNDTPEAIAYLQRLRADCTLDGYPAG